MCVCFHSILRCWLSSQNESAWTRFPWLRGFRFLLAGVNIIDPYALLTADVATPMEDAVTLLLPLLSSRVVPTSTAQEIATVYPVRGDVADPVPGAEWAGFRIRLAEIGWILIVDQVSLGRCFEEVIFGPESLYPASRLPMLLHHHLRSAVVFVLEVVTNDPEVGLGPPAGLHLAAAWQPVALTFEMHVVNNGLGKKKGKRDKR